MPHRLIVAQLAVSAHRAQVGQIPEMREAVRRDAGDVPEKVEVEHPFEAGKTREPLIGEWPVNQEMWSSGDDICIARCNLVAVPCLQHRKVVQKTQAGIGHQFAAAEVTKAWFSL